MAELTEEQRDQLESGFLELETKLSIHQLFLLLKIEVGDDACGVHEPIWPQIAQDPIPPITLAPGLKEWVLLQMAQARQLESLGMISLETADGPRWLLTDKGRVAVDWWRACLDDCAREPAGS